MTVDISDGSPPFQTSTLSPNWALLLFFLIVKRNMVTWDNVHITWDNEIMYSPCPVLTLGYSCFQFSSVQSVVSDSLWPHESQHARPPCPPTPRVYPNPCPSSRRCHPAISSLVVPLSSCAQSLPASGSFPMSQRFTWGGQSIGVSASASVLPMNTQDWSPLAWTGWISLKSKGLSRVFSNTTA